MAPTVQVKNFNKAGRARIDIARTAKPRNIDRTPRPCPIRVNPVAYTMAAALLQEHGPVELLEVAGADHFQINMWASDPTYLWVQRVRALMQ